MGRELVSVSEMVSFVPSLGSVILWDDFEKVFKWSGLGVPVGWAVDRSQTRVWRDDYSMHIKAAVNGWGAAQRYAYVLPGSGGFCDFLFLFLVGDNLARVEWSLHYKDAGGDWVLGIAYNSISGGLEYYSSAGSWEIVPGGSVRIEENYWHRLRVDFNFESKKYGYLMLDGLLFDLSAFNVKLNVGDYSMGSIHEVRVYSTIDGTAEVFVDDYYVRSIQRG